MSFQTKHLSHIFIFILSSLFLYACTKESDNVEFVPAGSYLSAAKGKFITYRLDSTVTLPFGSGFKTVSYTVKDSIVDVFLDNSGRETYKIFRFQFNPTNNTWNPTNTFLLNVLQNSVEYVENNLRFIKLVSPVTEEKEWQGNAYITQSPFNSNSFFSSWTYKYSEVGVAKTVGGLTFPNTVTVVQYDSTENKPFYNKRYNSYEKGYEIYAKGVGLVYRDLMSWEYQVFTNLINCKIIRPKTTGSGNDTISVNCNLSSSNCDSIANLPNQKVNCDTSITSFNYSGYGIKQTIIDHN